MLRGSSSCPLFWVIEISSFERLLYFVFMLRVFLTGSQCSDCSFSYYGEAFPQKSLCSIFWRLNLTSFLLTCTSEVHFVPVFFRLKILLAQACFLLAFAICSVLMEKGKDEDRDKRGIYPESLHMRREMNVAVVWLLGFVERELGHGCLGSEFIGDFWYILMYVS